MNLDIDRKLIMLPGPTNVSDRVTNAMIKPLINHRSSSAKLLFEDIKNKAQKIFQTSNEIITLTCSGTGGWESSVTNLIKPGDNVIVPSFGEFGHRWGDYLTSYGANVKKVIAEPGSVPNIDDVKKAFEEFDQVKALFVVYNESSIGTTVRWLDEAGKLCSKYGAFFVVDSISNLGGDDVRVDDWNIDFCITASQKCLAAPPGLSIISLSEKVKDYLSNNPSKSLFFNLHRYLQFTERGETPFTPSLPLFYALNEAFDVILEEGLSNRIKRHQVCANAFYGTFENSTLEPFAEKNARSNTVISIKYPENVNDADFRSMLENQFGIIVGGGFGNLKGKIFRIGSMGEINKSYVLRTLSSINSTFSLLNKNCEIDVKTSLNILKELNK